MNPVPTITIKVSDEEKRAVEAAAASEGVGVSEHVRRALGLYRADNSVQGLHDRVEDHERRLSRLEELAGL